MIQVSVGLMGSNAEPVSVEQGSTVAQVLEKAGVRLREGATVYLVQAGDNVSTEAEVADGQTLIVVGDVRGG